MQWQSAWIAQVEGGELAAALSSMGSAERLEAIQQRVKRLAVDVVGEELSGDDPLLERGTEMFSNTGKTWWFWMKHHDLS